MNNIDILQLSLSDCGQLFCGSIPVGFVLGCFPMLIGVTIHGLINIFKKV